MPYITQERRGRVDRIIQAILDIGPLSEGEVNYVVSTLTAVAIPRLNYAALNAAIGMLECAKLELYRRIVAPYETRKMVDNGDLAAYQAIIEGIRHAYTQTPADDASANQPQILRHRSVGGGK